MKLLGLVFLLSAAFCEDRANMAGNDDIMSRAAEDNTGSGPRFDISTEDSSNTDDYDEDDSFLNKIVGGEFASRGEIPWQAWVQSSYASGGKLQYYFCGAVIINEYWLLTAASCINGIRSDNCQVKVGDYELDKVDPDEQLFSTDRLLPHRLHSNRSYDYDIALIKIKPVNGRGIVFSSNVQPIYLPPKDTKIVNDTQVLMSGWGTIGITVNDTKQPSMKLKKRIVSTVDFPTCKPLGRYITERMLCTVTSGMGFGDSGGPVARKVKEGYYELYGIVSFGSKFGDIVSANAFTYVPAFLSWIYAMVYRHSDDVNQMFFRALPAKRIIISNEIHTVD